MDATESVEVIEVDWADVYLYGVDEAMRMALWRAIARDAQAPDLSVLQ